ncbi:MAG TPA: NADH-quinone oxidoreductase subunit L, partial [Verrucomicrobiae bacterium]|nr:NADH-quinone oxidoreductase subunit L [Verrucomicrobiae bacterium]
PWWPWFQSFLGAHHDEGFSSGVIHVMIVSALVVFVGGGLAMALYGYLQRKKADEPDVLERLPADVYTMLQNKFWIDEIYGWTVIRFNAWFARACAFLDEWIWGGMVTLVSYATLALAWLNRAFDECVINLGFDQGCDRVSKGGSVLSRLQDGRVQNYLRVIGVALLVLVLFLIWGGGK